jgi:hypothetical protein
MPTRRNNGSTMRSNSRITGPIRRRSTSHCRAPGSQTPPALRIKVVGLARTPHHHPADAERSEYDWTDALRHIRKSLISLACWR